MARPSRTPDLLVHFSLTVLRSDGSLKRVRSGYRPIYNVRHGHWSSAHHEFVEPAGVETGKQSLAEVWLIAPDKYPNTFWVGREVEVAEGPRVVGVAEILEIINPVLGPNAASTT